MNNMKYYAAISSVEACVLATVSVYNLFLSLR